MKPEFAYANNWLEARFVVVGVGLSEDSEAGTRDEKSLYERNMKGVQLNFASESCRQSFDDSSPQDGLSTGYGDGDRGENDDRAHDGDGAKPAPAARLLHSSYVWFGFCQQLRPILLDAITTNDVRLK